MKREPILVAMSGGVDSSVGAALLRRAGHPVVGVFMRGGVPIEAVRRGRPRGCCSERDAADVRRVADRLGIPFHVHDLTARFDKLKTDFADAYHAGFTPNPCIECNRTLKFGALLDLAAGLGCRAVATGHYAIREELAGGAVRLRRGRDRAKDQSYVLLSLDRATLRRARFPLGAMTKSEVRALAAELGLAVAGKPDSQDVCFVVDDYRSFLARRDPERLHPGRFVDLEGRELGAHPGHQLFTIGQRRRLGLALGRPLFVIRKTAATNEVVLGGRQDLAATGCVLDRVSWISMDPVPPGEPFVAAIQVRHRHEPAPATVTALPDSRLRVAFEEPVLAVAPGQGAGLYRGDVLLAGGRIREAHHGAGA